MYSNYNAVPPIHLIKNQISKFAKRLAIVQTVFMGSLVVLVALLYNVLEELLIILQEAATADIEAIQASLTILMDENPGIFSALSFIFILLLVSGIMYLFTFFRISKSFRILARIIPQVAKQANNVGNFIRYALFIQIASLLMGTFIGTGLSYITEIAYIGAFVFLILAYYNISLTFKALKENQLYPKKESKLLFYSQIVPLLSMIPLTFSVYQLSSETTINLTPLIIAGVIIILGYVGLMIGFFNLSNDIKLVANDVPVDYDFETSTGYTIPQQRTVDPQTYKSPTSQTVVQSDFVEAKKTDEINHLQAQFCPNCGVKLKPNKIFCHKCGSKVDEY